MNCSQSLKELATALSKAQGELNKAVKNTSNPYFKSKYANLEGVWDACRGQLTQNGLSVVQLPGTLDGKPSLTTTLLHSSGEWISNTVVLPLTKAGPQELGSCLTYVRRYALASVVGVAETEDDDAEIAEGRRNDYKPNVSVTEASEKDSPPLPPANFSRTYKLTEKQVGRLYAIGKSNKWTPAYSDAYVLKNFKKKVADLFKKEYDDVCEALGSNECTQFQKDELKEFVLEPKVIEKFNEAKKAYVDHSQVKNYAPTFDDGEELPF